MSRASAQQRVQREHPQIHVYSSKRAQAIDNDTIPGLNFDTVNFGAYMPESDAHERARDFYETLDAVAAATPVPVEPRSGEPLRMPVQRVAPVSDSEIAMVRAAKEATLQMKHDQYWTSQIDPALPWTLTEVTKVRPDILEKRLNAIKQLSQYTLDYEILRHLGHGGDPRLAELQYMIDQGMMDHMPRTALIKDPRGTFEKSNFSIWNVFNPGSDSNVHSSKFNDQRLNLARTGIDDRYTRLNPAQRPHIEAQPKRSLSQTFSALGSGGRAGELPIRTS
jgi:hypothetical protein